MVHILLGSHTVRYSSEPNSSKIGAEFSGYRYSSSFCKQIHRISDNQL